MDTGNRKVHFSEENVTHYFETAPPSSTDSENARQSLTRRIVEKSVFKYPKSQLERMHQLIASWRNRDISIVFGNLGRQPFLLHYYLDLCIGCEEKVKIFCDWDLSSEYQTANAHDVDFLIHVEPHFGFTIHRQPTVKHLVVLTSHLSLCYWDSDYIEYDYLHLSDIRTTNLPDSRLENCTRFKPPIFHTQALEASLPRAVLLDVSRSRTAREAYLCLLTGREIVRDRPYNIEMDPHHSDIIRVNLKYALEHGSSRHWFMGADPISRGSLAMDFFLYKYLGII